MSTKKRFTIAQDLATGIRNTIQSASTNQGQLHYDMMPVNMIEPDPNNPRKLLISFEEVLHGLHSTAMNYEAKQKEFAELKELSESIKKIGIRNAIEVYKEGDRYRIITGQRRYWAAILAEQKNVPVRISQKLDEFSLRYTQWVENMNRQDLSLWEKYNNLVLISDAYHKSHQSPFSETILKELLGISTIQAYRYFCLLKADEKIIQLIETGKLNNVKIIQELVSMKDKGARNQMLAWIHSSHEEVTSLNRYREVAGKKSTESKLKKTLAINLGKLSNIQTARHLLQLILADDHLQKHRHKFTNLDWSSSKAVSLAFKQLFKTLHHEVSSIETS